MKLISKKLFSILVAITLICSIPFAIFATESDSLPSKPDNYYVYDMAEVINDEIAEEITLANTDNLAEYGEIVIVTVKSVDDTTLSDYATELFSYWDIGGDDDKGALLVLDIEGENYRSVVGSGFNTYLSETQLKDILDGQVEYYFAMEDYNSAAQIFVTAITDKIVPTSTTDESEESADTSDESIDENTEEETDQETEVLTEDTTDETDGNKALSVVFSIFKALLVIVLILLIIVIGFLVLVNLRSQKRRKSRRKNRKN
ncbi:MAG: TPM domain-containing protein [Clostridia bacterium]